MKFSFIIKSSCHRPARVLPSLIHNVAFSDWPFSLSNQPELRLNVQTGTGSTSRRNHVMPPHQPRVTKTPQHMPKRHRIIAVEIQNQNAGQFGHYKKDCTRTLFQF